MPVTYNQSEAGVRGRVKMWKKVIMWTILIFLVPFFVTLFWTGVLVRQIGDINYEEPVIKVKTAHATLEMNVTDYMIGVLATRLQYGEDVELIKAQAVMIRTEIMRTMGGQNVIDSDKIALSYLTQSERKKLWKDKYKENEEFIKDCIKATNNTMIFYDDKLITCPYTKISAGKTRPAGENYPWLKSVDCSGDIKAENYATIKEISKKEFVNKCKTHFQKDFGISENNLSESIQIVSRDEASYISKIKVGTEVVTGEELADALGLESPCFSFEMSDKLKVTVKGKGSGYGMSMYSAQKMAEDGKNFEEILKYFYVGIELKNA